MKVASVNKNLKRQAISLKANKIRQNLFSFAKNEINEHQAKETNLFSFSNQIEDIKNEDLEKEIKMTDTRPITKQISLTSQKTSNDSFSELDDSDEEESSDMSCEEEEDL